MGSRMNPECKIYIGGLPDDANKFDLEDAFSRIGRVRDVWVARKPPGFAFIEMEDRRDATDACKELDGTRLCGNRVKVEMSNGGKGGRGGRGRSRSPYRGGRSPPRRRSRSGGRGGRSRSRSPRRSRRSPSYRSVSRGRDRSKSRSPPPKKRSRSPAARDAGSKSRSRSRSRS